MKISDAEKLYVGTDEVDKVYVGDALVWEPVPTSDADATAFLTAAGITDLGISDAIDDLVVALKATSLWSKLHAVYPFVGGTADTHKYNLKDPRDIDAAFRLTYIGTPTHSSNGFLPNTSGGRADTNFIPGTHLTVNSMSMAYYSRSDTVAGTKTEMGNFNWAGPNHRAHLIIRLSGNVFYYGMGDSASANASGALDSRGLFVGSRTGANLQKGYRNGSVVGTNTSTGVALPTNSSWIGGINSYIAYTDRECAFASIGDGLSDAEVSDLYTAVQAFQTALGRQV